MEIYTLCYPIYYTPCTWPQNLQNLVPHRGEKVEVIVKTRSQQKNRKNPYPLRGKPIHYEAPFDSVAENEWDAVK